jgi:hypothetical protein
LITPCDGLDGHAARDQSRPYESTEVDDESPSSRPAMALTGMPRVINHAPTRAPRSIMKILHHAPTRAPRSMMKILHHACEELDGQAGRDQSRPYENTEVDDESPSSRPAKALTGMPRVINHAPTRTPRSMMKVLHHAPTRTPRSMMKVLHHSLRRA